MPGTSIAEVPASAAFARDACARPVRRAGKRYLAISRKLYLAIDPPIVPMPGPAATSLSEVEVHAKPDELHRVAVELAVERPPVEVLEEHLQIPAQHRHALEL